MKLVNTVLVLLLVSAWYPSRVLAVDQMVKQAQQELLNRGYNPGGADGVMGPRTRRALKNFQEANGLTPTRQLDEPTKHRLGILSPTKAPQPEIDPEQVLPALPDTELQPITPSVQLHSVTDVTNQVVEDHVEIEYDGHPYLIPRVFTEPSVQLSDTLRLVIEQHPREPEPAEQTAIDNADLDVSPESDASEAESPSQQSAARERPSEETGEPSVQLSDTLRLDSEQHPREPEPAEQRAIDNAGLDVSPESDASEAESPSQQSAARGVASEETGDPSVTAAEVATVGKLSSEQIADIENKHDAPDSSVFDRDDGETWLGESLISGWTNLELLLSVLLITFVLAALVLCVRTMYISPRRRRERLWEAFDIIERDQTERFEQAAEGLEHSVAVGLTQTEIDEARFALAYVRARTNQFEEAAVNLGTLDRSQDHSRETLYLHLWIKSRRGEHENVERFYTVHAEVLKDVLQARLIAGIAYLNMARSLWKRQEFAQSMAYYEQLRRLKVLQNEIPTQIDDHQITVAIQALYLNDEAKARKSFRNAIDAANDDKSISTIKAKLGLLLCTWHAQEYPDIDDELGELLDDLDKFSGVAIYDTCSCPACNHRYRVRASYNGQTVRCKRCRGDFQVQLELTEQEAVNVVPPEADSEADEPGPAGMKTQNESPELSEAELEQSEAEPAEPSSVEMGNEIEGDPLLNEDDLLNRNVAFWFAISGLFSWRGLPPKEGLPHEHRDQQLKRIRRVTDLDPHFPDARLVQGLILYFFHRTPEELAKGFELIEKVTENEITLAEAIDLRDRHRRFLQAQQDSLDQYSTLVNEWIAN